MKKHFVIAFGTALLVPVFAVAVVRAEDGTSDQNTTTSETTQTEEEKKKAEAEKLQKLKLRIEQNKKDLKAKVDAAQRARLKGKCKAAQSVLGGLDKRLSNNAANHTKAYEGAVNRLGGLITKLEAKNIDVTLLKEQHAGLTTKVGSYKTDLANYQQAVDDAQAIDCVSDPDGFKASLETARALREKLAASAKDIRAYVKDTIKPTLQDIRAQLESQGGEQ